jgi:hypothetical protein
LRGNKMFRKLRRILVETFIGALALGWMLAEIINHFVNIFASPVATWIGRSEFHDVLRAGNYPTEGFLFQDALPELLRFVILLTVWYALVRWLYFKPLEGSASDAPQNPDQATATVAR